ncbi:Gfo/Idh/MocA family protein [Candidatus Thioglobus sp. NP1]|uniref:Gfo/Idh/MocA family protein n=1 Tax=Candidatus Thioglobus sp. NP1 TaxID=2508687 RepID=UPI000DED9623|nr:Gfo/Idh/MocA family oxidoreductase [Candidatus Thioglobus sp. NP1]AXE61698.1 oxidoreductase [Candidatus Thioglobus sp. NP1]
MTKKLKVGIAGYGVVGKRRRECVDQNKFLEIIAVCDQIFQDEVSIVDGVRRYKNYKKLLEEDLDILIVCLTNDIAPEVTIAALNLGIHVFCEKPPGRNVSDIIQVIDVEKKNPNLKLMYGFNHRYHHSVQDALKLVHSGELGNIINIRGVYGKAKLITFNQPDWRTKREVSGGGVLLDQGIHMIDLIRLFGGEFESIHSFVSNSHWGHNVEDNAYALMKTSDGIVAMMHSSATQWRHRFNLDINLEKGSVILGGILSGTKSYGAETLTVVKADPENDLGDPMEQITRYNKDPSWSTEIDEFIKCIIEDKVVINGTSDDALQTMKLVYEIYYADSSWREKYDIPDPKCN